MKRTTYIWMTGTILTLGIACQAQSAPLGDYARAARKQNKPAATRTFDNDNLPKDSQLSVVGNAGDSTSQDSSDATATGPANGQDPNAKKSVDAEALKAKVADQKNKIDMASRELDVTQREYRLRAASFYADAGDRLRNSAAWDKEDADYKKKIADKEKALADAKKQLEDSQEEMRKAGVR